jgi:aminopeptidase-like protein
MDRAWIPSIDLAYVPSIVTRSRVREAELDLRALWMLPFIDGESRLADVLLRSGLPVDEARAAVGELVTSGIVALRRAPD